MLSFATQLKTLDACDEARKWVGKKSFKAAWKACERPEWMLWLLGAVEIPYRGTGLRGRHSRGHPRRNRRQGA